MVEAVPDEVPSSGSRNEGRKSPMLDLQERAKKGWGRLSTPARVGVIGGGAAVLLLVVAVPITLLVMLMAGNAKLPGNAKPPRRKGQVEKATPQKPGGAQAVLP